MKYPKIPKAFLRTSVELIVLSNKTTMTGTPKEILHKNYKCNYQSSNDKNSSNFERSTGISGVILIDGNIFKDNEVSYGGTAIINGVKHQIVSISLVRNADGTVNHTRILTK